jgi:hypothetical protein
MLATRAFKNTAVGSASQNPANPRIPVNARSPRMLLCGTYCHSSNSDDISYFIVRAA